MGSEATAVVLARWRAAVESDDEAAYRALHTPDAVVWKNFDGRERTVAEAFRESRWERRFLPDAVQEDVRVQATERGILVQLTMRAPTPAGTEVVVPTCMVVTLDGDRIARVDEYVDSGSARALLDRP